MSEQASSPAGEVRVVGTAHVSADSVAEVEGVIAAERPDVVAVELDEGRYRQLKGETPDDLDAADLLRGNTVFQFLAYWMLSYVQARLGDQFDITPGADMLAGIETAEELGIDVALVDRDIQTTVQRFWARLSAVEKLKLVGSLALGAGEPGAVAVGLGGAIAAFLAVPVVAFLGPVLVPAVSLPALGLPGVAAGLAESAFGLLLGLIDFLAVAAVGAALLAPPLYLLFALTAPDEEYEELDMSDLTEADVVTAMMEEFRQFSPGGAEALIDERDAFIAHRLVALRESGQRVVAVVGAGHREGIERYLDAPETLPPMESLVGTQSSGFSVYKAFGYLFTLGFFAFFGLLVMATVTGVEGASSDLLLRLFGTWFIVNAVFSAGLAKLAGAHWSSAGVGGAVAWLTSVNPLLAPGWFAGYVELRYLNVNVADIGTLNDIIGDEERPVRDLLADLREVPLFRLIAVVALTNVGSFIGSWFFASVLLPEVFEGYTLNDVLRLMVQGASNSIDIIAGLL
ncbi:TraB/GumN family protein [Halosegnis marinus]|uniref:TraB/GumN family protein n=1 Tax=Halosegnis marinus TaxID=3034023 RepID=A0ABD5ZL03_9EURY|nr:TraB/GumN family protein [Halosegnis sp. DT85]